MGGDKLARCTRAEDLPSSSPFFRSAGQDGQVPVVPLRTFGGAYRVAAAAYGQSSARTPPGDLDLTPRCRRPRHNSNSLTSKIPVAIRHRDPDPCGRQPVSISMRPQTWIRVTGSGLLYRSSCPVRAGAGADYSAPCCSAPCRTASPSRSHLVTRPFRDEKWECGRARAPVRGKSRRGWMRHQCFRPIIRNCPDRTAGRARFEYRARLPG